MRDSSFCAFIKGSTRNFVVHSVGGPIKFAKIAPFSSADLKFCTSEILDELEGCAHPRIWGRQRRGHLCVERHKTIFASIEYRTMAEF